MSKVKAEDKENMENEADKGQNGSMPLIKSWPQDVAEVAQKEAEQRKSGKAPQELDARQDEELARLDDKPQEPEPERPGLERLDEETPDQDCLEKESQERPDQDRPEQEPLEKEPDVLDPAAEPAQNEAEADTLEEERKAAAEQREEARLAKEADGRALEKFLGSHGYTGANVKRKKMMKTKYPLHTAVKCKDTDIIRLLLEAQADPELKNSAGETPFQLAARLFKKDTDACTIVQQALRARS